ncbi:MAG: hypothetical protein ACKO5L_03325, partial [Bacteroidota bacterium]
MKAMINYWPKKRSYICNFSRYVFILLLSSPLWSQREIRFHAVLTHPSLKVDDRSTRVLNSLSKELNLTISLDYFTHPLAGKLPRIPWGAKTPYYSTSMRKYRDAFFNNAHKKQSNDYYFFITEDTSGTFFLPRKNLFFFGGKSNKMAGETMVRLFAASKGVSDSLLMDSLLLKVFQSDAYREDSERTYPFHDDVENLATSNGLV